MDDPQESQSADLLDRLEFDYEDINKADWGPGDWLNEPDKVQFMSPEGYPCLIVRGFHGGLCGYVGITSTHPCYGLHYDGMTSLEAEIIHAEFRDRLMKWGRSGRPTDARGLPDMGDFHEHPEPTISPAGEALANVSVHGGLTWSDSNDAANERDWENFKLGFPKAREQAKGYPLGDAARWLHKWAKAEDSYSEFKRLVEATCICFVGLPKPSADHDYWVFGFDCGHAGDYSPAVEATLASILPKSEVQKRRKIFEGDVYRNLAYVENQCLQLAIQLKEIETNYSKPSAEGNTP